MDENKYKFLVDSGFAHAEEHRGTKNPFNPLKQRLDWVLADYKNEIDPDPEASDKEIAELDSRLENFKEQKQALEDQDRATQEEIEILLESIGGLEKDVVDEQPSREGDPPEGNGNDIYHGQDPFTRFGRLMAIVLIVLVGTIVYMFYSSTIYSSIFKNIGEELRIATDMTNLFPNVFDPNAFGKAWRSGTFGWLFTVVSPFLFLSMGFLLHSYIAREAQSKLKKYLPIASLLLCILLADALIAYKISQVIHEAKYLTGQALTRWEPGMILGDINFFLVLVFGFGAYLVWGFLLNHASREFADSQPGFRAKQAKKNKVRIKKWELERKEKNRKRKKERDDEALSRINEGIRKTKAERDNLERRRNAITISLTEVEHRGNAYILGWKKCYTGSLTPTQSGSCFDVIDEVFKQWLDKVKQDFSTTGEVGEVLGT